MRLGIVLAAVALHGAVALGGGTRVVIKDVEPFRAMDPLFECVRVAVNHRGETYSPAYIQGISGAAFRIGGPCPCAPTCAYAMETADLIELLGYELEHLSLQGKEKDPEAVAKVVARVKDEIRAGRPTPVWHAFTNAEWDVVCGFDEAKKQFLGRGSYAGTRDYARAAEDRTAKCIEICPSGGALIIGRKVRELDAREAELAALEEAVRHARSPRDRLLAELTDRRPAWAFRRGLVCYEWWIRDFGDPAKKPYAGDLYCLGVYKSTHRAGAAFLREIAPKHPRAKAQLEQAAAHFEAEADALDACRKLPGMDWGSKAKPGPDRNANVVTCLTKARDAYGKGIDGIEQALQAIAPERAKAAQRRRAISRKNGRVEIAGASKLKFENRGCSFGGAIEEMLRATLHPYQYHEIMGLSGLAFRVRWCNEATKTKWCPSCAIGEMPDEQAAFSKLSGWELPFEWVEAKGRDNEALRKKIVAAIDAGQPVVTYPPAWNCAVICGYEDGGKTVLVNDYMKEELLSPLPIEQLGPMRHYIGEFRQPPPLRDALLDVLKMAVAHWKRERHHGGLDDREYRYGKAAFDAWIGDLRNYDKLSPDAQKGLKGIDPWNYLSLVDARRAAVGFLKEWGVVLDGDARKAVDEARELHEQEVKTLEPLVEAKRSETKDWSDAARRREIEALTKARDLEAKAIGRIEKALASVE